MPANSHFVGSRPRIEGGILKLLDALDPGQIGGFAFGPFPEALYESFEAHWKSRVGGGAVGGADGYSFNVANDITESSAGEEGSGTGLSVTIDTWDNGGGEVGLELKWHGSVLVFKPVPKDDDGTGNFLRKDTFVDASVIVTPAGHATFNYDGNVLEGDLFPYAGIRATEYEFGARTGGANDNHWIDDVSIQGFPFDNSSAENGQTVQFIVSNDNPSLFSGQPAISPNGTLSYTAAPNACGVANVTVVAKDSGGTAYGGRDTSDPCTLVITVNGVNDAPSAVAQAYTARNCGPSTIALGATDPDTGGCGALPSGITISTPPSHGTLAPGGTAFTVVYTPAVNYLGPDSFSYQVTDGIAVSVPATVSITVTTCNLAPTAKITADGLIDFGSAVPNKLLISGNGDEACLALDGSLSSDPDGDPLTYAWFDEPSPVAFAAGVVVTNCFDLGEHTVLLVVTDPGGLKGSDHVTFDVISASEAVDVLITDINNANIARKNKRPFIASLKAASASADRGSNGSAANQLHALQNKIRAQVSRDNPTEAARWIAWAQDILDALRQ